MRCPLQRTLNTLDPRLKRIQTMPSSLATQPAVHRFHRAALRSVGILGIFAAFLIPLHAETYDLVGVTLADGGTITGQFDWDDIPGLYAYTDVSVEVTGAGAELGLDADITTNDYHNFGGLCFLDPQAGLGACSGTGLVIEWTERMEPHSFNPTGTPLTSNEICLHSSGACGADSVYHFSDGNTVEITGGGVTLVTPEPHSGVLLLTVLGAFAFLARKRISQGL
jgi:hypothetical protein